MASDSATSFVQCLTELNSFQSSLHTPDDISLGEGHPGNRLLSDLYFTFYKSTWYTHTEEAMKVEVDTREEKCTRIRFYVNPNAHGIAYSDLTMTFPSIKCKEGYSARWKRFPLLNYVRRGAFKIDTLHVNGFDKVFLDMYINSLLKKEDIEDVLEDMGHTPCMIEWNKFLPSKETSFALPWFYNTDVRSYFPLEHCGSLTKIYHELEVNANIDDLLQIKKDCDGSPVCFYEGVSHYNGMEVKRSLEVPKLPIPTMNGEYVMLGEHECDFRRCTASKKVQHIEIYYNDVEEYDSELPFTVGRDDHALVHISSKFPVHFVGWVCENDEAIKCGVTSNYTTNPTNPTCGYSPFKHTFLTAHGKKQILVNEMSSFRSSRVHLKRYGRCLPHEAGYGFWSNSFDVTSLRPRPGKMFSHGILKVRLEDQNPYIGVECEDDIVIEPYRGRVHLRARALVTKKLLIVDTFAEECGKNRSEYYVQGAATK